VIDPRYDIEGFIREQGESGDMERDPYSYAVRVITVVLEYALDDGISGSMSQKEFNILENVAKLLIEQDPAIDIQPRPG